MTEFEDKTNSQDKVAQEKIAKDKFAMANPNPVLSSAVDGKLQFSNPAALKLMQDLELERTDDLLPADHKGLVAACLKTEMTLTGECKRGGRHIVWSYKSTDADDVVYIYGYDVTAYEPELSSSHGLPEANPNPVLTCGADGAVQFKNNAVSQLLTVLGSENLEDVLPANHKELIESCLKTRAPVTEERYTGGRSVVWSYRISDDRNLIYIYGHDVTGHHSSNVCTSALSEVNPSPVLTSGPSGVPRYTNQATLQLIQDLGLKNVEDLLPSDHSGMVKASHSTGTPLTILNQIGERTFVWSYHPAWNSDVIYIYGHDVSIYSMNALTEDI
jgi:hypothetical protein